MKVSTITRTGTVGRAALPGLAIAGSALIVLTQTGLWPALYVLLAVPVGAALLLLSRRDAVTVLGVYLGFLVIIPARFAIAAYSGSLTPAVIAGLVALWIWACFRVVPGLGLASRPQPLRFVVLFLLWATAVSWALAFVRPLPDVEVRSALIGFLLLASACGPALLAADGIRTKERLDTLLRWLVLGAGLVAVVGIIQFAFGFDLSRFLRLPGLVAGSVAGESFIDTRSVLRRVQGTAAHPIEMAVFAGMVLPLALHYARASVSGTWERRGWWACTGLLLVSIPLTVSRSGIVALAIVALVVLPTWPWRERVTALAALAVAAVALRFAVPGLVGTLRGLFAYFGSDPSITHRTGDFGPALAYVAQAPWFGRGFHTFIPRYYLFIDDQYLLSLIETGVVGLAAIVSVLAVGLVLARGARRISTDARTRDLAQALFASLLVATVSFATFDVLSFSLVTGTTFLLLGCAGALWRMERSWAEWRAG